MLDFLDLIRLVPDRVIRNEHLLEKPRAPANLLGERHEIVVEALFARYQSEGHPRSSGGGSYRSA